MVDNREVCFAAEILRNGDGVVQVQDNVPVAARNENSFAGLLQYFDGLTVLRPVDLLASWVNLAEPGDGFVSLLATNGGGDFQKILGSVGGEETPAFMAKH